MGAEVGSGKSVADGGCVLLSSVISTPFIVIVGSSSPAANAGTAPASSADESTRDVRLFIIDRLSINIIPSLFMVPSVYDVLFMIGRTGIYHECPVYLLCENHAHELVGEGYPPE